MTPRLLATALLSAPLLAAVPSTATGATAQGVRSPCVAGPFHRLTTAWDGGETVSCSLGGQPADNCGCRLPGSACTCPKGHSHPTLDDPGRRCAFDSAAVDFVDPALLAGFETIRQIYVLDRDPNRDGCLDVNPGRVLVSVHPTTGQPGNANSEFACISGNGNHVAFASQASNLLDVADGNASSDVFVRNLITGDLHRVSIPDVTSFGVGQAPQGSSLSCWTDRRGRRVVFHSTARLDPLDSISPALEDVYLHDRDLDRDGVFDEQLQLAPPGVATTLISVRFDGLGPGNARSRQPYISSNGRYIAFESDATNLVDADNDGQPDGDMNGASDVFLFDRLVGRSERVSLRSGTAVEGDGPSSEASVCEFGRSIVFRSSASNLIPGASMPSGQIYLRRRDTGVTLLISVAPDGSPAASGCRNPRISQDGRFVAFTTAAANLLPGGDTNGRLDLYVYDRDQDRNGVLDDSGQPVLVRLSVGHRGQQGNGIAGGNTDFSADGGWIPFMSEADNLLPASLDGNCERDVYLTRNPLF